MKHIWSVLCAKSIIDSETNNISLLDILETINISIHPKQKGVSSIKGTLEPITIRGQFEIVSLFKRSNTTGELEEAQQLIEFCGPDNKKIKEFSQSISIPKQFKKMRARFRIPELTFFKAGEYKFVVKIKGKEQTKSLTVAEIPLDVGVSIAFKN